MPISLNKISFTEDLEEEMDELEVPKGQRKKAALEAGKEALDQIKQYTSQANSPVKFRNPYKELNEEYAEFKKKKGKPGIPNLRLNNDMLENLKVEATKKGFTIKLTSSKEKKKAYNHNTPKDKLNKLPKRQFIPDDKKNEEFKPAIKKSYLKKLKEWSNKKGR